MYFLSYVWQELDLIALGGDKVESRDAERSCKEG